MTKKYFIAIAATIKLTVAQGADAATAKKIAEGLCATFKAVNRDFDRERFMTACGF